MRRRSFPWLVIAIVLLVPAIASAATGNCEFSSYEERGVLWMFLGAFGFGFLTSLTPCVYPMIPITLAIFGARGGNVSKKKAILLAVAYVNGMCLTYTALGVTFALIGKAGDFGTQLASPWIVFPLVVLFVVLAASMFGAFDLNLPASWQTKLNTVGGKGFGGAFAMGLVGGLIAAPCTGPFLAGLLTYVATTAKVVSGGALLYVYGLGMGVLFFVLAAFAVGLPKSGRWMESVKSIGGIGLVLAAIYYLQPFLPFIAKAVKPELWFVVASAALGCVGIALGAITLSFHGSRAEKLRKAAGVAMVVIGALGVWQWKLTPKHPLVYVFDETTAFDQARAEHKGVMVDFGAAWCGACHELDHTFGDATVNRTISDAYIPLRFDVTADNAANDALKHKYGAETLPAVIFLDTEGNVLGRIKKATEADDVIALVQATAHGPLDSNTPCAR
ncbi:MAG TPA: cytochrome c biogenesis protein CcdA [Kofleriaceae bacterium]